MAADVTHDTTRTRPITMAASVRSPQPGKTRMGHLLQVGCLRMSEPWWKRVVSDLSGAPDFVPLLGIRPEHIDAGEARFAWEPPAVVRTPGGWVQGGFQGVVLDMVQTFAVFSQLPDGAVPMTLELKVSYLDTAFADRFVVT